MGSSLVHVVNVLDFLDIIPNTMQHQMQTQSTSKSSDCESIISSLHEISPHCQLILECRGHDFINHLKSQFPESLLGKRRFLVAEILSFGDVPSRHICDLRNSSTLQWHFRIDLQVPKNPLLSLSALAQVSFRRNQI